jgi:uncharacterized protein DUF4019
MIMRRAVWFLATAVCCLALLISKPALAQEAAAQKASEDILRTIAAGQYKTVWDQKTSKWLKGRSTEDGFLSYMAGNRPAFGKLANLKYVQTTHFDKDPSTGHEGDIYTITFRCAYSAGEFYEYVSVLKDDDGQYRFYGLYSAAVPKN